MRYWIGWHAIRYPRRNVILVFRINRMCICILLPLSCKKGKADYRVTYLQTVSSEATNDGMIGIYCLAIVVIS